MRPQTCPECGCEFAPLRPLEITCSAACAVAHFTRAVESPALTHREHAKRPGLAVPCTAHHVNFGGGCLNCGWLPQAVTP